MRLDNTDAILKRTIGRYKKLRALCIILIGKFVNVISCGFIKVRIRNIYMNRDQNYDEPSTACMGEKWGKLTNWAR